MLRWMPRDILRWATVAGITAALCACAARHSRSVAAIEQCILDELASGGVADLTQSGQRGSASGVARFSLPSVGPITLADLFAAAATGNPALAAARSEIGIAAGHAWQASLYPNPRIDIAAEEVPFNEGMDRGIVVASMTQPLVIGERLHAGVDAADAEEAASRARAEWRLREVLGEVAQLHARLVANRGADAAYAELGQLGAETLRIARTRFEAKAAPETEVIRPQIELYQIEFARARLGKEKAAAGKQLSLLLGGIDVDVDRLEGEIAQEPPALALDDLTAQARESHPALIVADREIDAAAARLARVKAQRVPDLDVRFGAGYKGETDEGIFEVGAGMTVPIWDQRQGEILAARFDLMRARQQRLAIENDLLAHLAEAHSEYDTARAQLQLVREQIVPAAQRSFELTQKAYRGGHATFLELLDAQRTLAEARATLYELRGAAAIAHARIMPIVGWSADAPYLNQSINQPDQPTNTQSFLNQEETNDIHDNATHPACRAHDLHVLDARLRERQCREFHGRKHRRFV